jgi:hypothetical protein
MDEDVAFHGIADQETEAPSGVEPLHRAGHVKQRVIALTRNIGFAGVRMTFVRKYIPARIH